MILVVNIFFHILNFAVVIGLGVYIFRSKVVNMMRQEMIVEVLERSSLFKRLEGLKKQSKNLILAQEHQRNLHQELSRKMVRWDQAVKEQQVARHAVSQAFTVAMQARHAQAMQERQKRLLAHTVLTQALDQGSQDLARCFADSQVKNAYVTKLIDDVRKGAA